MHKLSVTPFSVEQAFEFGNNEFVENIIVGEDKYALRNVANFTLEDIKKLTTINKKIWVSVNKIMHKTDLDEIGQYLIELCAIGVYGLVFSDLGIYMKVKKLKLNLELMYNTETTITNAYFTHFAKEHDIEVVELAKEITLNEIKEI